MQAAAVIGTTPDAERFSFPRFLRAVFIEGGRFWERRRLAYNGIQLLLTAIMLVVRHSEVHYFIGNLGTYVAFAIVANSLYTAAYLPEALLQIPLLRRFSTPVRWWVFGIGTAFASFLTVGALYTAILVDPVDD